jgi:uncharacterized NAD(P)/FAD-binding protein YdhS
VPETYDVIVLGGGLSGSLVVMNVIDALVDDSGPARAPLRILIVDRHGAFGSGIPYGKATTRPSFLLLGSVASSTPPAFHDWLRAQWKLLREELLGLDEPALTAWVLGNDARVSANLWHDVSVPRWLFGRFVTLQLEEKIQMAAARGVAEVVMLTAECVDIQRGTGFRVLLRGGAVYFARNVVLAIGASPRKPAMLGLGLKQGYVDDPYEDACEGLSQLIADHTSDSLDVVLMGSGASSCEMIYYLARTPALRVKVRTLQIVSISGYLCGGAVGVPPSPSLGRPWAVSRPASREYVEASSELARAGTLSAVAGRVVGLRRVDGRLEVLAIGSEGDHRLTADVLVNCMGAGAWLPNTHSTLILNLIAKGGPFRLNAQACGFVMRPGTFEIDGVDGCFLIGPLLNQGPFETQVESILAVYRVAEPIARVLYSRLTAAGSSPNTAMFEG